MNVTQLNAFIKPQGKKRLVGNEAVINYNSPTLDKV